MAAGVYLHIPFCKSRCSYCDFATDVYRDSGAVERYVEAIAVEISNFKFQISDGESQKIDTLYFGGGTPSLLLPHQIERTLNSVREKFAILRNAEVTLEMNPATVTPESLAAYRELGINRASFGIQTFDDRALKLLARGHNADDARKTFTMLRRAGFENISLDLIAGLPNQTIGDWEANLTEALRFAPEHISLYLLEIHEGTPLSSQIRSGRQPMPDDELAAEMYEMMLDRLAAAGYEQYEISNFARAGFAALHNVKYWRMETVYGFGVSAHSFDGHERYSNERDTAKYVAAIEQTGTAEVFREKTDLVSEAAFLGLRLESGIDAGEFQDRFGIDLMAKFGDGLRDLRDAGLVDIANSRIRLTRRGKLFSNEVFAVFV